MGSLTVRPPTRSDASSTIDVRAALGEAPRRGEPGDPGADDGYINLLGRAPSRKSFA